LQTIHDTATHFKIVPLSDRSVLVNFGNIIDPVINEKVISLHKTLQQSAFDGFIESVPAYASLAVFYDVLKIKALTQMPAYAFVKNQLILLLDQLNTATDLPTQIIKIPVCYDTEFGIDLQELAEFHRLTVKEIIQLHTAEIYRVYMIGFMPGFAYMGKVLDQLITPRKEQPRLKVAAGSVGIAGSQTGIYSIDSPGGWQIIGKTPLQLFDANRQTPCLLSAGDRVQFFSIDKNEFKQYNGH
jgi:inhibitor of KinA